MGTGRDADRAGTVQDFKGLWRELDQARQTLGWTRDDVAQKIRQLSGHQVPVKTVHDRMSTGRRVPWSEVRWYVEALGLETDLWEQRWRRAEVSVRTGPGEAGAKDQGLSDMPEQGSVPGAKQDPELRSCARPAPTSRRRRRLITLGAVISVAILIPGGFWTYTAFSGDDELDALACARVTVQDAEVYRVPGDATPITTKLRGEKVTYPREIPVRVGPDGHRYRMVRTPTRTSSGYAYMLADTLSPTSC